MQTKKNTISNFQVTVNESKSNEKKIKLSIMHIMQSVLKAIASSNEDITVF